MALVTHRRGYRVGDVVVVNDSMQRSYSYAISVPSGGGFAPEFKPRFSPKEMLELGVFEGKYCSDCRPELPGRLVRACADKRSAQPWSQLLRVKSRQSLAIWRQKGWIIGPDPRGWFQWYCRYYLGRRLPEIDRIQIRRWRNFARHAAQVRKHCMPGDISAVGQRQALLQCATTRSSESHRVGHAAARYELRDLAGLAFWVALCLSVSAIGGAITRTSVSNWYQGLSKPWFNPPDRVFAPSGYRSSSSWASRPGWSGGGPASDGAGCR